MSWPEPHVPTHSPRRRLAIALSLAVLAWVLVIAAIVSAAIVPA
jgi:hypothetical protein